MWVVLTAAVVLVKQFLMRLLILQPGATNSSQAQGAGTKTCKLVAVTQLCVRVSVSVWEGRALRGADALKPVEPVTQTQTHICNLHVLTHRLPAETGCTLLQHPCGCTHMCVCMPTVAALFSLLRLIGCTPPPGRFPTKHFSLYFTHWDRWCGTLHPKYEATLFRYFDGSSNSSSSDNSSSDAVKAS